MSETEQLIALDRLRRFSEKESKGEKAFWENLYKQNGNKK